jgi:predicted enzyme related to lactoylglutathione lyase
MPSNIPLIVYPVKDVEKAKTFYNAFLGVEPYYADEYYIGYKVGDQEFGLDPNGTATIAYADVDDIEACVQALKDAGGEVVFGPQDVGAGRQIARVKFEDGVVGFRQDSK